MKRRKAGLKSTAAAAAVLCGLVLFAGCRPYRAEAPKGFAEIRRPERGNYLAVSPEGVRFRIRTVENYPRMDTDFWAETLAAHLREEGYSLVSGPEKAGETIRMEWGVPYNGEDYMYTTAVKVSGRRIVIIESGAPYELYTRYADRIEKSLENLDIR
ncbi:MAG: hypothetical protein ACLFRY_06435 [Spirochaetia bacterium]